MSVDSRSWIELNQLGLNVAIADLLDRLEARAAGALAEEHPPLSFHVPSLNALGGRFDLSEFERAMLMLAGAVEMSSSVALACASCHGDIHRAHATFSLGLAVLPAAHWSAITPNAALRRYRLVHVERGESLALSPLQIDERILHLIAGLDEPDSQ